MQYLTRDLRLKKDVITPNMPQYYGAKGDGVTDDTAAIQSAVDAVGAAGGGEVFFPAGFYKITSTIEVDQGGVTLVGEGLIDSMIINSSSSLTAVKWSSSDPDNTVLNGGGMRDIRVGVTAQLDSDAKGVELIRTNHVRFTRAMVENHLINLEVNGCQVGNVTDSYFACGQYFADKAKSGSRSVLIKNYEAAAKETANFKFSGCSILGHITDLDSSRDPMCEIALLVDSCDTVFFDACIFQSSERLIQLRTSRASDKIASLHFTGCFADGNLGGSPQVPTADYLFALDGCAATPALSNISWVGGDMSNAREDGVVINQSTEDSIAICPATVSNIGKFAVNATTWRKGLTIGGAIRNVCQNGSTSADGGGVKIGAAQSSSMVSFSGLSVQGIDYSVSVNGSPGASGELGTGILFSSYAGVYDLSGAVVRNCATARSISVASTAKMGTVNTQTVTMSSGDFESNAGSPTVGTVGGGRRNAWLFDAASTEIIQSEVYIPPYYGPTVRATLVWTNAGAGSGNVVWNIAYSTRGDGEDLNTADGGIGNVTITAPAQDIQKNSVWGTDLTVTPGEVLYIRISRIGGDAADTLANDAAVLGLILEAL